MFGIEMCLYFSSKNTFAMEHIFLICLLVVSILLTKPNEITPCQAVELEPPLEKKKKEQARKRRSNFFKFLLDQSGGLQVFIF